MEVDVGILGIVRFFLGVDGLFLGVGGLFLGVGGLFLGVGGLFLGVAGLFLGVGLFDPCFFTPLRVPFLPSDTTLFLSFFFGMGENYII